MRVVCVGSRPESGPMLGGLWEEGVVGGGASLVVVWADPGVTTGWCVVRVPIKELLAVGQVALALSGRTWWRSGQFRFTETSASVDAYLGLCRVAWERAGENDIVAIGAEGFSLQMLSSDDALLEPVRFLAILRDRLRGTGVGVQVQWPGDRLVISDDRLKLWDMWKPGAEHGRDAQRHALLFLRRFSQQEKLRLSLGWEG